MAAVAQGIGDGAFAGAVDGVVVGDQQRGKIGAVGAIGTATAGLAAGVGIVAIGAVDEAGGGESGNETGDICPRPGAATGWKRHRRERTPGGCWSERHYGEIRPV